MSWLLLIAAVGLLVIRALGVNYPRFDTGYAGLACLAVAMLLAREP